MILATATNVGKTNVGKNHVGKKQAAIQKHTDRKHIGRKHNDIPVKYVDGDYTDDGRPMGKKGRKRYRDSTGTPRNIKREKSAGTPGERQFPCPHCTHWAMTKETQRDLLGQ